MKSKLFLYLLLLSISTIQAMELVLEKEKIEREKKSRAIVANWNEHLTFQKSNSRNLEAALKGNAQAIPETLTIIESDGSIRVGHDTQEGCKCIIL